MKARMKVVFTITYMCGLIVNLFRMFARNYLNDFWEGFCEGITITAFAVGIIYFTYCFVKKINPYDFHENSR